MEENNLGSGNSVIGLPKAKFKKKYAFGTDRGNKKNKQGQRGKITK